ncbi:MAG: hypothetical protein LBH29_01725, partial [Elusimicrobiota bacterium]|nr:hypothetical protein [Elusimicrobiota bacterium]
IFWMPIVWSLFCLKIIIARLHSIRPLFKIFIFCFIVSALFIVLTTFNAGITSRYSADWHYLIILASLVVSYFLYERVSQCSQNVAKIYLWLIYILMFLSILENFFLIFSQWTLFSKNIYYYLAYCFNPPFIFSFPGYQDTGQLLGRSLSHYLL